MQKKSTALLIIFWFCLIFGVNLLNSQSLDEKALISPVISKGLVKWHFNDVIINNDFSQKAFSAFIKVIDKNKRYFLLEDIDLLNKQRFDLDDQLNKGVYLFLEKTQAILMNRVKIIKIFTQSILSRGFNYTKDESIELSPKKRNYSTNLGELKEYWHKILKYQALMRYASLLSTDKKKNKKQLKKQALESLQKSTKSFFNSLEQGLQKDLFEIYINSLMNVFDPHTSYFPAKEKEDFDISMTGKFEGIGALLGQQDGFVKIERIIPGGPCWIQNKLEPGDLILKVAQEGKEPVDIVGLRTVDAVKHIRGKKRELW